MKLIDLTHTFTDDMPVYPGDPIPSLTQTMKIVDCGYNEYEIKTGTHVGTHMDAPFHQIDGGKHISEIPVDRFMGKGHLINAVGHSPIPANLLDGKDIGKGDILLVMTGFSEKFREKEYSTEFPEISEEFAEKAVALGVSIVGMDTLSPDRPPFPVHKILLGSEVLIIENLTNLKALEGISDFTVFALPTKFKADAAPVRVVAYY